MPKSTRQRLRQFYDTSLLSRIAPVQEKNIDVDGAVRNFLISNLGVSGEDIKSINPWQRSESQYEVRAIVFGPDGRKEFDFRVSTRGNKPTVTQV